ncbi:MAG TPA: GNAT family N-acetyltransferase, partial [Candidatus Kapabacteria bacterium]|nr:GNAT family N-acetyltransferase [Candidatus Kapabacteria bacterium]
PLWMDMLSRCSPDSIYARFRYFFQWKSHETATHYCYIDYDRQVAIVAEYNEGDKRRLVGVGRLILDPTHETGEYAVLAPDDFQNRGLGSILTDYCLEIARKWNIKILEAQTTTDNVRMLSVFNKRDFEIRTPESSGALVEVSKKMK